MSRGAGVECAFGKPIDAHGRVIVPVARVHLGLGGGGQGDNGAAGVGAGGGMETIPLGVVEIAGDGTRFIPVGTTRYRMEQVLPGVSSLQPGQAWLLAHQGEGAIVETPPEPGLAEFAAEQARRLGIDVRYLLVTGTHPYRWAGLSELQRVFPRATLVVHRALIDHPGFQAREPWGAFTEAVWEGRLGGEPLFLLYAPRRSWTDQLIIFRGALLTGDWSLDGSQIPTQAAARVRDSVAQELSGPYRVHTFVTASGQLWETNDDPAGLVRSLNP